MTRGNPSQTLDLFSEQQACEELKIDCIWGGWRKNYSMCQALVYMLFVHLAFYLHNMNWRVLGVKTLRWKRLNLPRDTEVIGGVAKKESCLQYLRSLQIRGKDDCLTEREPFY